MTSLRRTFYTVLISLALFLASSVAALISLIFTLHQIIAVGEIWCPPFLVLVISSLVLHLVYEKFLGASEDLATRKLTREDVALLSDLEAFMIDAFRESWRQEHPPDQ